MGIEIGASSLGIAERIEFFRTLGSWLVSGGGSYPVHEAIRNTCDVFSRDEYATFHGRMERISREYTSGQMAFHESLRQANLGFTSQELSIIESAEKSNQLRIAVPAMVEAMSMRVDSTKMLVRKMTMPIVGGFMLILMSLGVMIFMLPTVMEPVIERNPEALADFPLIIRAYWAASLWLRANYVLVALIAIAPVVIFLFRNTSFLKPRIESVLMWFTPTRRLILAFNAVLIVYFMPALVRSGMPLPEVLRTLANSVNNLGISGALRTAAHNHEQGYRLGDVLAVLPLKGSFRSAVEAGEKTGKIAERVEDLKMPYTSEFDRISRRAVSTMMLVVMAGLMPFFIISMYTTLVSPMIALMEYS